MLLTSWLSTFQSMFSGKAVSDGKSAADSKKKRRMRPMKLEIEHLEDRALLATLTWVGDVVSNSNWNAGTSGTNTNWNTDTLPASGDTLVFPASASQLTNNNDTTAGNSYTLQFQAAGYKISGNQIVLGSTYSISFAGDSELDTNIDVSGSTINVISGSPTIGGVISGTSLVKTGAGTLTLTGNNTYVLPSGTTTTLGAGTLVVAQVSKLGTGNRNLGDQGDILFTGPSTLQYTGSVLDTTQRNFDATGTSPTINVSNAVGDLELTGGVSGSVNQTLTKQGPGILTLSGPGGGGNDNGSLILNAQSGTVILAKLNSTTAHAVAGISDIAPGATVKLGTAGTGGDQIYGGTGGAYGLVNMSGGTLNFNGKNESFDTLTGTGTLTNNSSGTTSTFTIGESNGSSSFGGVMKDGAGTLAFTKIGSGTFTTSGTNTYSGQTTVSAGTLALSSASNNNIASSTLVDVQSNATLDVAGLSSGTLNLASGQTLEGNGRVTGTLNALSGATVSPGETIGILNTGNLQLNSGSTFAVQLATPYGTAGTGYDQANVTGTVNVTGATLSLSGGTSAGSAGQVLTLINNDGTDAVVGTFAGLAEGSTVTSGSFTGVISYKGGDGNDVTITVAGATTVSVPTNGTADSYILKLVGGSLNLIDASNSNIIDSRPMSAVTSYTINGEDGQNDTLTLDFSGGNPVPAGGLTFNGGTGGVDTLVSKNGTFTTGHIVSTGAGSGTIQYDSLGLITFTGLEPITDDNTITNFTIDATAGSDNVTIAASGTRTLVSEAANQFESVAFMNKTNVTVNGLGGNDTISLGDNSTVGAGLTSLTVNAGGQASDAIAITGALALSSGSLTLTAPSISHSAGAVALTTLNLNGAVNQTGGSLVVSGTTTIVAGTTGDVTLNQSGNNFGTVATTSAKNVTLADTNAIDLGASTISGNVGVTAAGAITDSGNITVTGTSSFTAGSNAITLDNNDDFTGAVSLSNSGANNISIKDLTGIVLGTSSVGSGTFTVNAIGITQTGAITQAAGAGNATFNGGAGVITLTQNNDFTGGVSLSNSGGFATSVTDLNALILAASTVTGSLTANAGGAITQSGALNATTTLTTTSTGGTDLSSFTNSVGTFHATNSTSGNVALLNSGITLFVSGISQAGTGTVAVTNAGAITVSGTTTTAGSGSVTLSATGVNQRITVNGGGPVSSTSGDVTLVADNMTVSGAVTAAAGHTVTLRQQTNSTLINLGAADSAGTLGLTDAELDLVSAGTINIGDLNSGTITLSAPITRSSATNLTLTTGSDISFAAGGSLSAGAATVTLSAAAGSIIGDVTSQTDITATTLNATASSGIGAANALETIVSNFIFANTTNSVQDINTLAGGITVNGTSAGTGAVNITETSGDLTVGTADVVTNSGAVALKAAAANKSIISASGADVQTTGGATSGAAVTWAADNMSLAGNITAGTGLVTLMPTSTATAIQVGTGATDAAGVLGLTDVELNKISNTGGVTIGNATITGGITVVGATNLTTASVGGTVTLQSSSGNIAVNAALTTPAAATLQTTTGSIAFGAAGAITAAGSTVTLSAAAGNITGNAASLTNVTAATLNATASTGIGATNALETSVSNLSFANTTNGIQVVNSLAGGLTASGTNASTGTVSIAETSGNLTVGAADIVTNGGIVNLTASGTNKSLISAAGSNVQTTNGVPAGAAVSLIADHMDLGGNIVAGTSAVTLTQSTSGTAIDLGSSGGPTNGKLELSDAELDQITAAIINIGDLNSGTLNVSSAITSNTNLSLMSGTSITSGATGTLYTTGATITLNSPGAIGSSSQRIQFADNSNTAQQNVIVGSSAQASSVFLDGLGSLTLGNISGGAANTSIDVTARGNLVVIAGATTYSGTSTTSLGADLKADGTGDDGVGTLTIGVGSSVYGANIKIRGADEDISSTANVGKDVATGPAALYHLDETSGSTATDSSGNSQNGTYVGGVTLGVPGVRGGDTAVSLNGTSGYIAIPAAPFGNFPTSGNTSSYVLSAETWFNATPGSSGIILGQVGNASTPTFGGASPGSFAPGIYLGTDGKIRASMFYHSSVADVITSSGTYNDGAWHQVADVYNNGVETLYIDGVAAGSQTFPEYANGNPATYYIGTGYDSGWTGGTGWHFFNGKIDDFAIYSTALTAGQISADYLAKTSAIGSIVATNSVTIQSSVESRPMSLGGIDPAVVGINLTDAELARILTAPTGTITIGDSLQTGNITFTTAKPATTAGAATVVLQSTTGGGQIILDDDASGTPGTALNGNGGTISLTAGTGGISAKNANDTAAEIATSAATVTLNTTGPIGTSTNRVQFADNTNTTQQKVVVGSANQASSVFLDSLGSLTLGSVTGSTANTNLDVTALADLFLPTGSIVYAGTGTVSLAADVTAAGAGENGTGTLTINSGASVTSTNATTSAVTLRGADIALTGTVSGSGGVVVRSSQASRPMNLGSAGTVAGINLTDAELALISTAAAGTVTFGDTSQTGTITLTTARPATTAGAATVVTQSTSGSGQIILDDLASATLALDGNTGNVSLTAGTGGIVEAATNLSGTADVGNAVTTSLGGAGAIGSSTLPLQLATTNLDSNTSTNGSNQFLKAPGGVTIDSTGLNAGAGTITLAAGTFTLGGSNRIADSSKLNVSGATAAFAIGSNSETVDTVLLTDGSITGTSGVLTSTNVIQALNGSDSAILAGANGLSKSTSGTVTLSGINTYTNATTISGGTLVIGSGASLASGSNVSVNSTGNLAGTGTVLGSVTVNSGGKIVPGTDGTVGNLTIGSGLSFNGGTYKADISGDTSDTITTSGIISLAAPSQGLFTLGTVSGTTTASHVFTFLNNSSATNAIANTPFSGIAEGSSTTVNGKSATYSYLGGTGGNDFTLSVAGPYAFTIPVDGQANVAVLRLNGTNLDFIVDGTTLQSVPVMAISSLTITGEDNFNDKLTLDFTGGDFGTSFPVTFNGGTGGHDVLATLGGTFTTLTSNYINANDGSILLANGSGTRTINYTGLEPITIGGNVADVILYLPAAASNAVLEDDGTASNGAIQIRSSNSTFETTAFPSPSNSLQIVRGNTSDTLNITVPALDYNSTLLVGGTGTPLSSVTFSTAQSITAGGGIINVVAGSIAFNAAVNASGSMDLTVGAGGGSQTAAVTVPSLVLRGTGAYALTNAGNDVTTLAAATSANLSYRDTNGFDIGTVSAVSGLSVGANSITLQCGAAVTQSQTLTASGLQLLGSGPYTLNNTGNDITTLAGNVAGTVVYVDKSDVAIGTVTTVGLSTSSGNITVTSTGALTVNQPISNTGSGNVSLTVNNSNTGTVNSYQYIAGPFSAPQAYADAITRGGWVATLRTPAENALAIIAAQNNPVWIGASDSAPNTAQFEWDQGPDAGVHFWSGRPGVGVGGEYTNWRTGEPNDQGPVDEQYLQMYGDGTWNDIRGTASFGYLLEKAGPAGAQSTDDLILNANVTTSGGSGNITLNGADDILQNSGAVTASGTGAVTYNASTAATDGVVTMGVGSQAASTTGTISVNAAGSISLQQVTTGGSLAVTSTSGNVTENNIATAGTSATFNLQGLESTFTIASVANVTVTGGALAVSADNMSLAGSITATGQIVTLNTGNSGTSTAAIDLGSTIDTTPNTLELSNSELSRITAGELLIGSGTAGAINFSSGISSAIPILHLKSGSTVTGATGGIVVGSLAINANGAVAFSAASTDVTNLAIKTTMGNITFTDANALNVSTVDNVTGVDTDAGSVTITATTGDVTVSDTAASSDIDATNGITLNLLANNALLTIAPVAKLNSTAGGVTISSDQMALNGSITASGQTVLLKNSVGADTIDLGGADAAGKLALTDAELDGITAATLEIGSGTMGAISITGTGIGPNSVSSALALITGAGVTETGTLTYANGVRISAGGSVTLSGANNVGTLAVGVTGSGNTLTYNDFDNVAFGSVDGVNGATTVNGVIAITTTSGSITVNDTGSAAEINAGTSTISLTAGGTGSTSAIVLATQSASGKAVVASGGVTLIANNMNLSQTAGSANLVDAGSGTVSIQPNIAGLQVNVGGSGTTDTSTILDINAQELSNINGALNFSNLTSDFHIVGKIAPTGGNTLTIQTTKRIVDDHNGSGDDIDPDIVVSNVVLIAGLGVGVSGGTATDQEIETAVSNLEASGGTGGVVIANTGNLTIGGISATVGVSTSGGNISVTTVGGLTVNENVSNTGAGNVTLTVNSSFVGGAFQLITGSYTFDQALADAVTRGGWLATIRSATEETAVMAVAGGPGPWIGASDAANEGHWFWVAGPDAGIEFYNGAPVNSEYNAWSPGEPNNLGGAENAAQIWNGQTWNDANPGNTNSYILESPGVSASDDLVLNANVSASGGNGAITLSSADDILQTSGSVSATGAGAVTYTASTKASNGVLTMSTGTQATSATGAIALNAASDISLQLVTTGGSLVVTSTIGNVTVNNTAAGVDISAGAGASFNLQGSESLLTIASGANVTVTGGGLTASADNMDISGTITATGQSVTLQTGNAGASSAAINLGAIGDGTANTLELSDVELGRITATKLVIGSASAGSITFVSDINLTDAPIIPTLRLNTGSTVTGINGGVVVAALAINAHGAVNFTDSTTNVTDLAIKTSTGNISFTEANGLNVADVDSLSGVDSDSGGVTLNVTTGDLTVSNTGATNDIDATSSIVLNLLANEALLTLAASAIVGTTGGGVTASSDKMNLLGLITAAGQTVALQTGNNGTSTDAINLGSSSDSATNVLELSDAEIDGITASKLVIGTTTAGAITVSADIDLTDTPTVTTLRLNTSSTVTGTAGGLVVSDLAINAAGAVNFTDSTTNVNNLAIKTTTGNIAFTEANGLNVADVDGLHGVDTDVGNVAINLTAGNLTVLNTGAAMDIDATTGIVLTLLGNDAVFAVNGGADVETVGDNLTNDITVNADEMALSGTVKATGLNQIVTLRNNTANKQIILGSNPGTAGILELDNAELNNVSAGKVLRIGRNDAAATGNIDFTGAITAPTGWSTLHLTSLAAVLDDHAGTPDITVANLAIDSVSGIGAAGSDSTGGLEVLLTKVAFNNTTSNSVAFTEGAGGGGIVVNSVDGVATSNNSGTTTTITANSPVTFAVNTTSGTTITANAVESATVNFDNVTVNAGVTVESTGGDVVFNAGDRIVINNTATVKSDIGNITLSSGVANTDADGSQTLDGTIQANNSSSTRVTIDLRIVAGSASQAATGKILAGQLQLLSTTNGGSFSLATSVANDVDTIAAGTDGSIAFRDLDDLTVGAVNGTVGITTTSDDVQLIAGTTIVINDDVNLVAGHLGLQAGAAVTQNAGDDITANGLALTNVGPFTLTNVGNNIATLAANSANTVDYVDADSFAVGAVTVLGTTTTGLATSNDDVRLTATAGGITISNTINLSNGGTGGAGGSLDLLARSGATQAVGANILANSLLLRGTGAAIGGDFFNLPNTTNNVATLAANLTNGAITYEDADALAVGIASVTTVAGTTSATGIAVGNPSSVAPAGGDVFLRAGQVAPQTGILSVTQPITTTSGTLGNLTIAGGVQFTGSGSTSVGSGDIDLAGGPLNEDIWITVPTTHTMSGGTVTYKPNRDIIIDAPVTVIDGNFILDADGEGSATATTIAQTTANLGAGNGDGGVWVRSDGVGAEGAIDVQSGVDGGGSLVIAGSQIHNTPFGGAALTGLIANTGVQIDNNTAVLSDVNADTSISILVKTAGVAGNDLQLDGNVHSDGSGPINVQVEDTLTQNGTVQLTSAGTITYDAEDMIINTGSANIDAGATGIVWLRNRSAGRQIDVGTNTAGQLGITDAELDRIAKASVIRIGRRDAQGSGDLNVTAGPITPANNNTLHLISGNNIVDTSAGFIVVTNLALEASNNITLDTGTSDAVANDHDVANLAMATYNAGADATYVSRTDFNVGTVDGVVGINVQDITTLKSGIEAALAGDVVQSSPIISNSLQLLGQGNFTLDLASNDINTLAANVLNSITFDDVDDVTVGTITSGLATTIGTSSSSIVLTAPTVIVNNPIVTTSELGFVILDVTTLLDINGTVGGASTVDPIINSMGFVQQTGTGSVQLQGRIVTTNDNVSFNGPVKIGTTAGSSALIDTGSTGGGNITFHSTVQGTTSSATPTFENLTLNAGTGDILFNGQVGGAGLRLGVVTIQTARNVTTNVGFTAREISQLTGTGETRFNGFAQTNQPNGINLTSNYITFNGSIQTTNGGIVRINNASDFQIVPGTGAISADGAVTQTGAGLNLIGGDIATTDDVISFATDTYITNTSVLMNSGLGDVSFAKLLQVNNKNLTIRDGNSVDLGTRTTIANGTLTAYVGNSPATTEGTLNMVSGAIFTGAGTVNANLNVGTGATLAPASATTLTGSGVLTVNGNVNLASGSVFAVDLNGAAVGTGYDQLVINGAGDTMNITAGAVLQATRNGAFTPAVGTSLKILDGVNTVNGIFTGATDGSTLYLNGAYLTINYNNGTGDITLTGANAPGGAARIIDNDEVSTSQYSGASNNGSLLLSPSTAWTLNTVAGRGFTNDLRFASGASTQTATATYTFNGLTPGATYRISTTWFGLSNRATNAPFTITGGTSALVVLVNQQKAPVGFSSNGAVWQDLTTSYTVNGTSLTITLGNKADGYVIADAVRIEPQTAAGPEIQVTDTTDANLNVESNSGAINFGTTTQGGSNVSKVITITNTGLTPLILGSATLTAPAGFAIANYVPTSLAPGASQAITFTLLSTTAGNYSGSVSIQTNDTDENPFIINLTGSVVSTSVWIVDNDPNTTTPPSDLVVGTGAVAGTYNETGTWFNNTDPNVGYLQDLRFATANSAATAVWNFTGLAAGTYRISVTYRAETNRATNASFTVTDGVTPTTVSINETNQPSSFQSATVYWQDLVAAYGNVTSGNLTVTLNAAGSNGYVIADAVRIEKIVPEMAAAGPAPQPVTTVLAQSDLNSIAAAAIVRWQQVGLSDVQLAALRSLQFQIQDLPGAQLSGETEATVFIDPTAAGYGWYVDPSSQDDSEFNLVVSDTERKSSNPDIASRMDLLTIVMHELGLRLGLKDIPASTDPHGLMTEIIDVGTRRLVTAAVWNQGSGQTTTGAGTSTGTTAGTGTTTGGSTSSGTGATGAGGTTTPPLTAAQIKAAAAAAKAAAAKAAAEKAAVAKAAAAKAAAEKAAAAKAAAAKAAAEKAAAKVAAAKAAAEKAAQKAAAAAAAKAAAAAAAKKK